MIVNERITSYINSLDSGNSDIVNKIRLEAIAQNVPIIRQESENFLKVMLRLSKPKHILEVGTAVGYSALLMSENMPEDCTITTIEKYEKRIPQAKENFKRAGKDKVITLLEGDALDILKSLEGPYEFIFMDAAKGQYMTFFEDALRLLAPDGVMVSDNVLQDGDVIESRFAVTRRNRTIHSRMREYLYTLTHHDELQTAILPIGDGMAVSVRRKNETS
ncbi:MAG: O-methyltransferase [Lachnospiraceae bacterium]|nr:O-methyltransferase [Lachnospiraceae bacterium]